MDVFVMTPAQADQVPRARFVRVVASVMQVNVSALAACDLAHQRPLDLAVPDGGVGRAPGGDDVGVSRSPFCYRDVVECAPTGGAMRRRDASPLLRQVCEAPGAVSAARLFRVSLTAS
jgi:hypothetical protein